VSDNYDNLDDDYTPSSASGMPMILAALGVGTVVGSIVGFVAATTLGDDGTAGSTEDGITLPVGACKSAFTDQKDSVHRNDWYGSLDTLQRKTLYKALPSDEHKEFFYSLDAELQADVCSNLLDSAEKEVLGIVDANKRLEEANAELFDAQQELADLKTAQKAGAVAGRKRIVELEARISELETELVVVKEERDELKSALDSTVAALDTQIKRTQRYKALAVRHRNESVENQWSHFVAEAQKDICNDKAFAGQRESCWDEVSVALPASLEDRYSQCVKSGQAAPILREFSNKESRPTYTESLGDKRPLKKWGVIFCDPTLPEAGVSDEFAD
jgi:hypothetical protein